VRDRTLTFELVANYPEVTGRQGIEVLERQAASGVHRANGEGRQHLVVEQLLALVGEVVEPELDLEPPQTRWVEPI
jgi:hypothetical protein